MISAGIYVHIPFCKIKCIYCDFYSVADRVESLPRFMAALVNEIHHCDIDTHAWTFDTLFIGGGTPSLLEPKELEALLNALDQKFDLSKLREITLEANPGEAPIDKLIAFRALGVNRLSMGVQSLDPGLLKFLTRIHGPEEVYHTFNSARKAGFDNINCDMIFNIPGQSLAVWQRDLKAVLNLGPEHLSCYSLTVEEGTQLYRSVEQELITMPKDDWSADLYSWTQVKMAGAGFVQYEISNWAKPDYECRHNLHYWKIDPYLAFGPSAYGFDGHKRWNNLRNLDLYIKTVEAGKKPYEKEAIITEKELANELLGFGVRISEGVDLNRIPRNLRQKVNASINAGKEKWGPYFKEEKGRLRLTCAGYIFADAIAVDLLL